MRRTRAEVGRGMRALTDRYRMDVEPGRIRGTPVVERPGRVETAHWEVPLRSNETDDRFVQDLAGDPIFAGRWSAGRPNEADRRRAGVGEDGWASGCDCGMRQPCRHAQTLLFHFREEAKRDPSLWLKAAGSELAALLERARLVRAALAARDASVSVPSTSARVKKRLAREEARAAEASGAQAEPAWIRRLEEPEFWNRDVSFADWLRPLAAAVRRKVVIYEPKIDDAVDSDVSARP